MTVNDIYKQASETVRKEFRQWYAKRNKSGTCRHFAKTELRILKQYRAQGIYKN